jgi:hypothetical protein
MTMRQTIDIPASHRITVDVPKEIPVGPVILTFTPAPAKAFKENGSGEPKPDTAARHEEFARNLAEIRALCKNSTVTVDSFLEERHAERDREYEDRE